MIGGAEKDRIRYLRRARHHRAKGKRKDRFEQAFQYDQATAWPFTNRVNNGEDFRFVDINPAGAGKAVTSKKNTLSEKTITECFPNIEKLGLLKVFRQVKPHR